MCKIGAPLNYILNGCQARDISIVVSLTPGTFVWLEKEEEVKEALELATQLR